MIRRTFQLVSGIGPHRERLLWADGITQWDEFRAAARRGTVVSVATDAELLGAIDRAESVMHDGDVATLASLFPRRVHWRLFEAVEARAAYLDIEADGTREPTVVGVMDAHGVATFIRERAFEEAAARLNQSACWVTFNGGSFDLPILEGRFAELRRPALHLDVKILARAAGLSGGLKAIEEQLGVARPPHLQGVRGFDAIRLWNEYAQNGDRGALRLLVEYNLYDAVSLREIAARSMQRWGQRLGFDVPADPRGFQRQDVLYDITRVAQEAADLGRAAQ